MTTAIVDIETDSLNPTKIHCIVARDILLERKEYGLKINVQILGDGQG